MGTVVPFKAPSIVRCRYCNVIKPASHDRLSHRGVDYRESTHARFWTVFASGWKKVEVVAVRSAPADRQLKELYYQCAECSKVHT